MRSVLLIAPYAVALTLASPAGAAEPNYWLVLHDGRRIEARGAPEVRSGAVLFRLPGGALASLPLGQIDLEATRAERSTPREARNLDLRSPEGGRPSVVGLAGEAAKRAGRRGAFVDLSRVVVPRAEPGAAAAAPAKAARQGAAVEPESAGVPPAESQWHARPRNAPRPEDPGKLPKLRPKKPSKTPS